MDGKSRWADNIMIERWFRSFKYEEAYLYVDKVIVYEDRVEVSLNLIPFIPVNDITKEQCFIDRNKVK